MKKIFLLIIITHLSSTIFCQQFDWNQVDNLYCKYLGYELKYQEGTKKFVVVLPDDKEVNPRDFYMGKVGQEYSYCAIKGYKIKQNGIEGWENTYKYPVCYKDNKQGKVSKEIYLHKLAYDEEDYADMFNIQDTEILEPVVPSVAKVESSSGIGMRSPITPYDWRDVNGMNYVTE